MTPPLHSNGPIVLIVDDDPAVRRSMKAMLEARFQVVSSPDGPQAIQFVIDHPGQVFAAFVDYGMPEMTGDLVCAALRSVDTTISLIGFSGLEDAPFAKTVFATLFKKDVSSDVVIELATRAVVAADRMKLAASMTGL